MSKDKIDEILERISALENHIKEMQKDIEWLECIVKKFDKRFWELLIAIITTIVIVVVSRLYD